MIHHNSSSSCCCFTLSSCASNRKSALTAQHPDKACYKVPATPSNYLHSFGRATPPTVVGPNYRLTEYPVLLGGAELGHRLILC